MDPTEDLNGSGSMLHGQQRDRSISTHVTVDEEVKGHDQGQDQLETDRPDLAGEMRRVSR